jgi:membrane-associated phospholipid phosphatase
VLGAAQSVHSDALDIVASLVTVLGQAELTGALALALASVWTWRHGPRGLAPLLMFAAVALEVALKLIVVQTPPPTELSRSVELFPFIRASTPYAYPSGHMARTAFLVALLWARAPSWRGAFVALVALMAVTRLYLAEHWPSDVVGGSLLGLAFGTAASAVTPALEKKSRPTKGIVGRH